MAKTVQILVLFFFLFFYILDVVSRSVLYFSAFTVNNNPRQQHSVDPDPGHIWNMWILHMWRPGCAFHKLID